MRKTKPKSIAKSKAKSESESNLNDGFTTSLEITNGEFFKICDLAEFLRFMFVESAPVPVTREERDALLNRYLLHCRREDMRLVSALRVSRGQSPLPARLTGEN